MKSIGHRWSVFFQVVVDPWVIALVTLGGFLGWVLKSEDDAAVVSALALIISLISGVVGSIITSHWNRISEGTALQARGQIAVRGLRLLLGSIVALDRRVREYLERQKGDEPSNEIVENYLEEVIGRCTTLQEEALSSIENWTDIVPEADLKSEIGVITDLREQIRSVESDLENLKLESEETEGKSQDAIFSMRVQMRQKENELSKTKLELASAQSTGLSGTLFGTGININPSPTFYLDDSTINFDNLKFPEIDSDRIIIGNTGNAPKKKCETCGDEFAAILEECPNCGSK